MQHELDDEEAQAEALLAELDRLAGRPCAPCGAELCGHELTLNVAMGFRDAPRCLGCLAEGLARPVGELREELLQRVLRRDCFRQGWERSSEREGSEGLRPECLWPPGAPAIPAPAPEAAPRGPEPEVAASWDAQDMSCGDLVLALRRRLRELPPGAVLQLRATDPAAPEDIPAWCRVTRNSLVRQLHPHYWIRKRNPHDD